jgi:hypothetical protein
MNCIIKLALREVAWAQVPRRVVNHRYKYWYGHVGSLVDSKALFNYEKFFNFDIIALSFVFDNYCPTIY